MTTATIDRPSPHAAASSAERAIPFGRLFRVEWRKATDTRSARWLIGLTLLGTVLIMLAPLIARHSIDQTQVRYLDFAANAVVTLLPVVVIMTLTTEWTQRTVLATFTQEPRRGRVIGAKVVVSVVMGVLAAVFGALVAFGALGIASASGRHVAADLGAANLIGYAAFILINILMGVAFGALLHNTAASIVLFFLLPTVFAILGGAVQSLGHWIDPQTVFNWVLTGDWSGHAAHVVVALALWVIVPLALGLWRTARREIK